jgi:hypothetical protein
LSTQSQHPQTLPAREKRLSLTKTLFGVDISGPTIPISVLAVGVGGKDLPGPAHDLWWLSIFFSKASFRAKQGPDATRDAIRVAIYDMYKDAHLFVAIVLYFTGHGNNSNTFDLHGGQSIDESTLFEWIDEARKDTGNKTPVIIVLDSCRPNASIPVVATDKLEHVYIIWACLPGQSSHDANLDKYLPYSGLLNALCLTLDDMLTGPPGCFMERVAVYMTHVIPMQRGFPCGRAKCKVPWLRCYCLFCRNGRLCLHLNHPSVDLAPIQDPVGWFPGFGVSNDFHLVHLVY